ncbi:MAG: D-alanyl-D-alanine carboxypeptidase, partial [Treponema sp.]|nr:D-alanyl-D-alanine carboxypeptidase [Treponema sp.]
MESMEKKSKVKYISDFVDHFEKGEDFKAAKTSRQKNPVQLFMELSYAKKCILFYSLAAIILAGLTLSFISYSNGFKKTENSRPLSAEQESELSALLNSLYPEERVSILKELPYSIGKAKLDVWAGSAILIDASNGCVLFEKNADAIIPPASIAKLFVMYIVFKDVSEGKISLDDIVTLPERSWAINMPKDASLMFLGQGQIVTLRELLKGLAVASGNDAALAVADYISGSTKAFVERMNEECAALGLTHTHFVEPSGYDEHNLTTARELAAFCCEY